MNQYQEDSEPEDEVHAAFVARMNQKLSEHWIREEFQKPRDWGVDTLKVRIPISKILAPSQWPKARTRFGKPLAVRYVTVGYEHAMRVTVIGKFCYVEFNPGRVFDDTDWRPAPALVVALAILYVAEALRPVIETEVAPSDWEIQRIDIARDIRTPGGRVPLLPRPPRTYRSIEYDDSSGALTGYQFHARKERRRGVVGRFYNKSREADRRQDVEPNTWRPEFSFDRKSANRAGLATVKDITEECVRRTFAEYFAQCRWDQPYPSDPLFAEACKNPKALDPLIKAIVRQIEADGGNVRGGSVLRLRRAALQGATKVRLKIDLEKGAVVCVVRLRKHCSHPDCDRRRKGRQRLCDAHYRQKLRAAR
jgi:hypothetical protein